MMSKRNLMFLCVIVICLTQSGCSLLALPFQALGAALGVAGTAAQVAIANAPAAAPYLLF